MPSAEWQGKVIAQSDRFETVEGNIYFPPSALKQEFFRQSDTSSVCPWKGTAHYFSVVVDGVENKDAAWYYPDPKPAAENIRGYVAFWRGVKVSSP